MTGAGGGVVSTVLYMFWLPEIVLVNCEVAVVIMLLIRTKLPLTSEAKLSAVLKSDKLAFPPVTKLM